MAKTLAIIRDFFKKIYFRYEILTAIYMLDSVEAGILNFLLVVVFFFFCRYVISFIQVAMSTATLK